MPKPVPQSLRRLLTYALPACVLSLIAPREAHAQRPRNALPPSNAPAPTDDYYRGQAPYPTTPGSAAPEVPRVPLPPAPGATPRPPARRPQGEDALGAFLRSEAGSAPLQLSQARAGWKSLRIARGAGDVGASRPGRAASTSGGAGAVLWSSIVSRFAGEPGTFLTRGRTVKLSGDEHILVYQAQFPSVAETDRFLASRFPRSSGAGAPSLAEWTEAMRGFLGAVPLKASLVNTRQVAALEEIEPFDFQSRFSSLSRDLEDSFREFQSRGATLGQPPSASGPGANGVEDDDEPISPIVPPARIPPRPATPSAPSGGPGFTPGFEDGPPRAVPVPDAVAQQAASEPLRRLFAAVQRYRADNGDVLPPLEDLTRAQAALSSYMAGQDPWRDPVSGRFFVPNSRLSGRRMVHLKPFAASLILFYSEPDASGKRTVLRLDGIIRRVSPNEWEKLNGSSGVS